MSGEIKPYVIRTPYEITFKMNSCSVEPLNTVAVNLSHLEYCSPEPQHLTITVLLCLVFLVGFVLNSFSLWVFCYRISHWTSSNVLQFHLALSDAIITPAAPLMATYFIKSNHWTFGSFLCKAKIALLTMHLYGSILFLMLISVHRYIVVVQYKKTSPMKQVKFVHKLCGGIWLLLLASGTAIFGLFNTSNVGNQTLCLSIHQNEYMQVYFTVNLFILILGFLVPFAVTVVCYILLASSVSRINTTTKKGRAIKSKSHKTVAICLAIFGFCFMPIALVRTIAVVVKMFFPNECKLLVKLETAYYICWIFAGANCCVDPLLYCFVSRDFNKCLRTSLKTGGNIQEERNKNELYDQDSTFNSQPTI
nr:P2Y purinoceptor 2-like [Paramormyrops kingsleyae]